jgi:hypothetical protein
MKIVKNIQIYNEAVHRVDIPGCCPEGNASVGRPLKIFVPYTKPGLTRSALDLAARYAEGLDVRVTLMFVQIVPFPSTLEAPDIRCDILARRVRNKIGRTRFPLTIEVILARERNEALRAAIPEGSLVLLTTAKHWWRTSEERLARFLSKSGCSISLIELRKSLLPNLTSLILQHPPSI